MMTRPHLVSIEMTDTYIKIFSYEAIGLVNTGVRFLTDPTLAKLVPLYHFNSDAKNILPYVFTVMCDPSP